MSLRLKLHGIWQRLRLRLWLQDGPIYADEWFSLNVGSTYRVLRNIGPLQASQELTYLGTYAEVADRGWDRFHQFEAPGGQVLVLPDHQAPRSVYDSLAVFDDVPHPDAARWQNPDLMQGLMHRAKALRFGAANSIAPGLTGLAEVIPTLLTQCLREGGANPYLDALIRVKSEVLAQVEALVAEQHGNNPYAERVLATLGSRHYFERYRQDLRSNDRDRMRHAARRLADIGDSAVCGDLEPLLEHPHLNVRFAARDALKKLKPNT